jgi:hypothetical protein
MNIKPLKNYWVVVSDTGTALKTSGETQKSVDIKF